MLSSQSQASGADVTLNSLIKLASDVSYRRTSNENAMEDLVCAHHYELNPVLGESTCIHCGHKATQTKYVFKRHFILLLISFKWHFILLLINFKWQFILLHISFYSCIIYINCLFYLIKLIIIYLELCMIIIFIIKLFNIYL